MSLINDALKRASQTDKGARLPAETTSAPLPTPVERSSVFPMVLGVIVTVLAAAGVWIYWRSTAVNHEPAPVVSVPTIASAPPPMAAIAGSEKIEPVPVPPLPAKAEATSATIAVTNAPPAFPTLKLQAIFFTPTSPRALINGRTVGEGDEVAGLRVKRIEADKVTVEWNGERKVIGMRSP